MVTLIVPCAGRNFINNQPRWTLKYSDNDILLSKCIKKLGTEKYDRIIVSILKEDLIYYSIEDIRRLISDNVEVCVLDKPTTGPADTIYKTILNMKIKGSIQIKDIDILFENKFIENANFISGIHLLNYDSDLKNVRNKSFITRNEKNIVMDIIEKNIKSDIISIGLYGFNSSEDFVRAYEILKNSVNIDVKLYVSHIITYLIGVEDKIFDFVEIDSYELLETEKDYEKSLRKRGTYIIDFEKIDVKEHLKEIKFLSDQGCIIYCIIKENDIKLLKILDELKIKYNTIIRGETNFVKFVENEKELKDVYINAN